MPIGLIGTQILIFLDSINLILQYVEIGVPEADLFRGGRRLTRAKRMLSM